MSRDSQTEPSRTGRRAIWALVGLLACAALVHGAHSLRDETPPLHDELRTLQHLEVATDILRSGDRARWPELVRLGSPHPPGIWLSALPLYVASGGDYRTTRLVTVLYLLIGMAGVFLLGRRAGGSGAGLLMAGVLGFSPVAFQFCARLLMEGLLAGILPWAVWALVRTEGFTRRPASALAFGLFGAWMALIKWTAFAFLAGPFLIAILYGWRRVREGGASLGQVRLGLLIGFAAGLVAVPWYLMNLESILTFVQWNESVHAVEPAWHPFASRLAPRALLYYAFTVDDMLGIVLAASCLVGMAARLVGAGGRSGAGTPGMGAALTVVFGAYVVLTALHTKEPRHFSPVAPALVFIGVAWFSAPGRRVAARRLLSALILAGTLGAGLAPALGLGPIAPIQGTVAKPLAVTLMPARHPPVRLDWRPAEILDAIRRDADARGAPAPRVLELAFSDRLPRFDLAAAARDGGFPGAVTRFRDEAPAPDILNRVDYVVAVIHDPLGPPKPPVRPRAMLLHWLLGDLPPVSPPALVEVWNRRMPMTLEIVVYHRTGRLRHLDLLGAAASIRVGDPTRPDLHEIEKRMRTAPRSETDPGGRLWTIGGRRLRIWVAPPAPGNVAGLVVSADAGADGLRLAVRGRSGERFRLAYSPRRQRQRFPFGISEVGAANWLTGGALSDDGTAVAPVPWSVVGPRSGVVYLQALLEFGDERRTTNWVAVEHLAGAR